MTKLIRNISLAAFLVALAACAADSANPVVGTWDTVASTPLGDQAAVWTIAADGTGMMLSDQGDQPIEGIVMDGNNFSFGVSIDAGGQSLNLDFAGSVDGDSLTGAFASDFGDFDVAGTRQ